MTSIYLDHAATTPMHPEVIKVMQESFEHDFGNPSSIHRFGRESKRVIDEARDTIAKEIQAKSKEIVFTGGGTEADNMAIIGTAMANKHRGRHIITTQIEHHAVLNTCRYLESEGFNITYLGVDKNGSIDINEFKHHLRDDTTLVSIMYGNNEMGAIQPISDVGKILTEHPAFFHTDAVQVFGSVAIDVSELNIDLMSMTSHKINGPKGTGFLYIKDGTSIVSHIHGGEQERRRRAGTHNVAGIVGTAQALQLSREERAERTKKYNLFKQLFIDILEENSISFEVNGSIEEGLPHILNLYFPGTQVESLLMNLDLAGVAVSSGSACTAGSLEPSHVIKAMFGEKSERALSSVRISFGLNNSEEEVKTAANITTETVKRLVKTSINK